MEIRCQLYICCFAAVLLRSAIYALANLEYITFSLFALGTMTVLIDFYKYYY